MSVDALQRQIELAELDRRDAEGNLLPLSPDADRRLVAVSTNSIIERAYGKPREYDPNDPREKPKIDFNPADYTYEQRRQIDDTIKMMRAVQAEKMAAKGEVIPPYDR